MATPFPENVVQQAWRRAGGKCECERVTCSNHYSTPHGKILTWNARGDDNHPGGWEAHHKDSNGPATVSNCEILCIPCHKNTRSYGG